MNTNLLARAAIVAAPIVSALALPAQSLAPAKTPRPIEAQADVKPPRTADPRKGYGEVTALTDAERTAGRRPHAEGPVARQVLAGPGAGVDPGTVYYAQAANGRTWASGATYKASFGADGFTYVPFLGARAPKNYPVRFRVAAVQAGGVEIAVAREVAPVRDGNRIVFDRDGVREIYDLRAQAIEQTFVVDSARAGDLVVELAVDSELAEDATREGVQFANDLGSVDYGTAYVVDGAQKRAISTSFAAGKLTLHVPATMRGTGAVVIDPVISTQSLASGSTFDFDNPDVAFDASNNRYLVVWQRDYSATDADVWCEMRDGNGAYVAGSAQAIENGSQHWTKPRVANLNAYDRFLVVAEQFTAGNPAGQQYAIWGCTVQAVNFALGSAFQVNGNETGDKRNPDVGGDPNLQTPTYWTVAYTRELSAIDHDILARQVTVAGVPRNGTIFVENSGNSIFRDVEISQSNGNLAVNLQRWVLVYSYKHTSTDWDVYGAALSWDGLITELSSPIENSSDNHRYPSVSSATHAVPGSPTFGVSFEDDSNVNDLRGLVVDAALQPVVPTTNLSLLLGASVTYYNRIETDGCRFAVTYAGTMPAYAATLGVIGGSFVVHEAPQQIGTGTNAFDLNIASRASAGGTNTGYGIVLVDENATPDRVLFARYDGHRAGGFSIRQTGCSGLGISASGSALLGRSATATLVGAGADLVGILVGVPGPALTLCSNCVLGVNLGGPYVNLANMVGVNLPIPCLNHLVGATLTVQGYAVGSGPCFGSLRLSDSLDIVIQ